MSYMFDCEVFLKKDFRIPKIIMFFIIFVINAEKKWNVVANGVQNQKSMGKY